MKRAGIILCMVASLVLIAHQSLSLAELPYLSQIAFVALGAVLALFLMAGVTQNHQPSYAGSVLFFSLALLDVLYLYTSTGQALYFLGGMLLTITGLLCGFYSLSFQKKQKSVVAETPIVFAEEEPSPILQIVDVPTPTVLREEPVEQPLKKTYVRTAPARTVKKTVKRTVKKAPVRKEAVKKTARKTAKQTIKHTQKKTIKRVTYPTYSLLTLEGVGKAKARKLRQAKIKNTGALLKKGADKKGRATIAKATGFQEKNIKHWVSMCDVLRVKGIGEEYSELIVLSGARTVPHLAKQKASTFLRKMERVNTKKKLVRTMPSLHNVEKWIKEAKTLPSVYQA